MSLLLALLLAAVPTRSQPNDGALMLGGGLGLNLYHGEFNSFQSPLSPVPGVSFALHAQYNLTSALALGSTFSLNHLNYNVTDFALQKYSSNFFGTGGEGGTYPGSSVSITSGNDIDAASLHLYAKLYIDRLLPENWTLFGFAGIGMLSFEATNGDGTDLPTNVTGPYDPAAIVIPFGGGAEYEINDRLRAYGEYTFHRGTTDYLDGYAHFVDFDTSPVPTGPGEVPTQSDHFSTLRIGLSYEVYRRIPSDDAPASEMPSTPAPRSTPSEDPSSTSTRPDRRERDEVEPAFRRTPDADDAFGRNGDDADEPDTDGDKLSDRVEETETMTDPLSPDTDGDGLEDGEEVKLFETNPLAADTDGDLLSDLSEVRRFGTSPTSADTDRDELEDNVEIARTKTDPLRADTDGDGVIDGRDDCPLEFGAAENNGCPDADDARTGGELTSSEVDPDRTSASNSTSPDIESPETNTSTPIEPTDLPQLPDGRRLEFGKIYFLPNSDNLDFARPETGENLRNLLEFLEECDDVGLLVEGHTSSEGLARWNLRLSQMRADRVREWLLANGVDERKILGTVGYGDRLPKVLEPSEGSLSPVALERLRAENRRITALVRKPCAD